jgi:hypothetical protein
MLSGHDVETAAFLSPDGELLCRRCAVAGLGEVAVARLETGLLGGARELNRVSRFEVEERAAEAGYECDVHGAGEEESCGWCDECLCERCGAVLAQSSMSRVVWE